MEEAKAVVLDERGFTEEVGWNHVKVRVYWEKKVYDRLYQGMPEDYEVTPPAFLLALGIKLPEQVRAIRFGQLKGTDVVFYAWKEVPLGTEGAG